MIQEEAFRCKHITERLLEFSRTGEPKREPTDLRNLVQAVLDVTQHLPNHKGKKITFETPADTLPPGDEPMPAPGLKRLAAVVVAADRCDDATVAAALLPAAHVRRVPVVDALRQNV